jgi:hypothetical protein
VRLREHDRVGGGGFLADAFALALGGEFPDRRGRMLDHVSFDDAVDESELFGFGRVGVIAFQDHLECGDHADESR